MANDQSVKLCLVVGAIILVAVIIYFCMRNRSHFGLGSNKSKKVYQKPAELKTEVERKTESGETLIEPFAGIGRSWNTNIGTMNSSVMDLTDNTNPPSANFADLVADAETALKERVAQPGNPHDSLKPMERLHRVTGRALMPRVSSHVTPFNVDVANPTAYLYMANAPRVSQIKPTNYEFSMSEAIRGSIPINFFPNVPLISKSRFGRDSQNLAGMFTPAFTALYNKYSSKSYKNLVQKVAGAGQAAGYGGASGELIMDAI